VGSEKVTRCVAALLDDHSRQSGHLSADDAARVIDRRGLGPEEAVAAAGPILGPPDFDDGERCEGCPDDLEDSWEALSKKGELYFPGRTKPLGTP
jgi:hypothetical protein